MTNWSWQDLGAFVAVLAYIAFNQWLPRRFPKPMMELEVEGRKFAAQQIDDLEKVVAMGAEFEKRVGFCTRAMGHDGPCNGYPRKGCVKTA